MSTLIRRLSQAPLLTRSLLLLALVALAAMAAFLLYATTAGVAPGFPLDDAWIHQTYARNLAHYGQFAYVPGTPSAGSTSPLWTLLLSAGYAMGMPYRLWTFFWGWLALTATGWGMLRLSRRLFPGRPALALACGIFGCLEWHLVWAALSGMETALFCAIAVGLLAESIGRREPLGTPRALGLGLLGGALILTRPEGLLLVGLIGLDGWVRWAQGRRRDASGLVAGKTVLMESLGLAAGCLIPLIPYLAFNLLTAGSLFPNTFYAKQAEYRAMIEAWPFPLRWARVIAPTLVGAQALLLPGMLWAAVSAARASWARWMGREAGAEAIPSALPLVYWLAFTALYAARLPVTYQHGRYLIPTIPVLVVWGAGGSAELVNRLASAYRPLVARVLLLSEATLLVAFVGMGAGAYAADVEVINGEMVAVAQWLNAHTPADALVAVHDIGAIGYFARRPLLDLAGLVTPEVVPFIRDEPALLVFMLDRGAEYLVTFPSWYPQIVSSPAVELLYQTDCARTRALGGDNMAVYRLRTP